MTRRHVVVGGVVSASAWVAPSMLKLDRIEAAVPSGPYVAFYDEDFQATTPGGPNASWSSTQISAALSDPNRRYLGRFGEETVTLRLQNLPAHSCVCIEFDLYLFGSWDGNHSRWGPDFFGVVVDGVVVMQDTFTIHTNRPQQTYGPAALNPAGTGTSETATLGEARRRDQVHPIKLADLAHSSSTIEIDFFGSGLEALGNESWGIDNVVVSFS